MNAIEHLLEQPAAQAIGWALLQFVWQGALVGLLSAAALFALRRSAADVRYVVATIGLSLMLTMPAVTALQAWRSMADGAAPADAGSGSLASAATVRGTALQSRTASRGTIVEPAGNAVEPLSDRTSASPSNWVRAVLVAWLSGVVILTLRLLAGWIWVQRLRSRGTAPAPVRWQQMAARLSKRLHIARPIRLLESAMVEVPTVIGWIRPVVLIPASALAGMGPQQLEAILAHELAHIRRHDYLVNLLQTLVETLLFYHPAVWWLSRRIRVERENCCDDLAVSLCGDPYAYARALADLEELRADSSRLVLAATGGSLLHRVRRLIGTPSHAGRGPGWLAGATAVVLIAGIAAGAVGKNALSADQAEASGAVLPAVTTADAPAPVPAPRSTATAPVVASSALRRGRWRRSSRVRSRVQRRSQSPQSSRNRLSRRPSSGSSRTCSNSSCGRPTAATHTAGTADAADAANSADGSVVCHGSANTTDAAHTANAAERRRRRSRHRRRHQRRRYATNAAVAADTADATNATNATDAADTADTAGALRLV